MSIFDNYFMSQRQDQRQGAPAGSDGGALQAILQYLSSMKRSAPTQRSPHAGVTMKGLRDAIALPGTREPQQRTSYQPSLDVLLGQQAAPPPMQPPMPMQGPVGGMGGGGGGRIPQMQRTQGYDTGGMDELTAALSGGGVQEGPNANIQDDTRERALRWLAMQGG